MDQYCMRSHELGSFIKNSSKRNFRLSIKASKIIGISKNETSVQTSDQSRDLVNKIMLTLTMMIMVETHFSELPDLQKIKTYTTNPT